MIPETESGLIGYQYSGAEYCHACSDKIPMPPDGMDEDDYDSDEYAKALVGEHESDSPCHCDACGEMLDCTLTEEGIQYVLEYALTGEAPQDWIDLLRRHGVDPDDSYTTVAVVIEGAYSDDDYGPDDRAVMIRDIADTIRDCEAHGVDYAIYTLQHDHPHIYRECACAQYLTDHRPDYASQGVAS